VRCIFDSAAFNEEVGVVLSSNKYLRDFKAKPLSSFRDDKIGVLTIVAYVPRPIEKPSGFLDKDTFSPIL
jgi:hypothetical protein